MKTRTPRDYRELLRGGRWFRGIPVALQDELLDRAVLRKLGPGQRLFSRGDPPTGMFAALDGGIRVGGTGESGKEALLTMVEPPSWFGEIAVFDGLERTHDASAEGEALVLQVPQPALDALLAKEPRYWRELALLMSGKLRLAFGVMEDSAMLPIAVRLARRLVHMAEGYGDWHERKSRVLELKQEQLAGMLSTSRQTANQVLKDLETQGLLRLTYGEIEILDLDGLRSAAGLE